MRPTVVVAASCIAVASGVLAGCGAGDSGSSDGGIEISVTHPEDLYGVPWLVGQERGYFEEAGVTIDRIVPAEGGGTTLQNIVAGRLPFGEVATGAVVNGFNEGAPVQVVGGAVQSVSDVLWVSSAGGPADIAASQGTTWGYTNPGSVTEAMSQMVPQAAGIEGVERASTGGTGAGIALLEAGDVDLAYAPPRVLAEQGEALQLVVDSSEFIPVYQQTVIVSGREYAQENPDEAKALLNGYAESAAWISENPDAAADLWAESADIDPEVARGLVERAVAADHWGAAYNPEALEAAAEGLSLTDDIESVDWSELATDEYLPEGEKGSLP